MCYFVSVGARAPARLLTEVFDEQLELDVTVLSSDALTARAFPAQDRVCLLTLRGCSCDFVGSRSASTSIESAKRGAAFRRSVARIARQLGSVRLLVQRERDACRLPTSPRSPLTVDEFLNREHWFIEDVLMEIWAREATGPS